MSKRLRKEEMREYMKARRERLKGVKPAELKSLQPRHVSIREEVFRQPTKTSTTNDSPITDSTQLEKGFGWTPSGGLITKKYNLRPAEGSGWNDEGPAVDYHGVDSVLFSKI